MKQIDKDNKRKSYIILFALNSMTRDQMEITDFDKRTLYEGLEKGYIVIHNGRLSVPDVHIDWYINYNKKTTLRSLIDEYENKNKKSNDKD